ncbi:hypothetical protein [Bradyrhizobium sp. STM 3562]|uniref:hypothetical protein n=1 Tax=Bradyrhizobium sp. STM 3562 TaxID=578924 RepID=UPI0038903DE1
MAAVRDKGHFEVVAGNTESIAAEADERARGGQLGLLDPYQRLMAELDTATNGALGPMRLGWLVIAPFSD